MPGGGAVNESVDAMLERVDADEAALMSGHSHPSPYFHLQLQPQPKLKTYSSAPRESKPYQQEGADSSVVRFFQPITPAEKTGELQRRTFPMGAPPTQVPPLSLATAYGTMHKVWAFSVSGGLSWWLLSGNFVLCAGGPCAITVQLHDSIISTL